MLLSAVGLNSGNYYYAIKGLFQQKYDHLKVVVIDNTPELGLEAEVLGLLREVQGDREVTVIDRVRGTGMEGSSIYLGVHKYCRGS